MILFNILGWSCFISRKNLINFKNNEKKEIQKHFYIPTNLIRLQVYGDGNHEVICIDKAHSSYFLDFSE